MSKHILYSVLQYRHSVVAGEALNLGILFSFPHDKLIKFVIGNLQRIKCAYPDFDTKLNINISKKINSRLYNIDSEDNSLFGRKIVHSVNTEDSIKEFISKHILIEDASSLQFSEPFIAVDAFGNPDKTIDEISRILLPDNNPKKEINRHNESFILKQFSEQLQKKNIIIDNRFTKNKTVETKGLHLKFDLAWKNGATHLIKPISFDLIEKGEIQSKSVQYYGYLNLLHDYAKINDCKFDLLLWKPQNENLLNSYHDAIEIIEKSKAPKKIYTEETLFEYIEYTAEALHKKDLQ
jgi:hypothetical protein